MSEPDQTKGGGSGDPLLTRLLCQWVQATARHAKLTVVITVVLAVLLGFYATRTVGFNVDPNALFSKDLRFQRMILEFGRYFPVLTDSLLIVIDGGTPEANRDAQIRLRDALAARTDSFYRVFLPGEEPFFERTGLMYSSVDDLEEFGDRMAQLQPVLGELARDPTLPTLTRVIQRGLEEVDAGTIDSEGWDTVLDHFRNATLSVFDEYPVAISWENVLLADSGFAPATLRVIVADPILDPDRVLAAESSIDAVRAAVRDLALPANDGVRVRVSGYPALNHEEMIGLAEDTALAGSLSFLLVVVVLARAYRSGRMVVAAAITLLISLAWSAAFAGATVAELNPISIAFGVLVIGLGVDFMIHFGMHFADAVRGGRRVDDGLDRATRQSGIPLVLCAATTSVGFLAFIPTDYRGVSDLGILASGGMLTVLFQTLTVFPALTSLLLPDAALERMVTHRPARELSIPRFGNPRIISFVAALLLLGALPLVPRVELDTNVIRIRNPNTESVQAFEDLLDSRESTPWYVDVLSPSLDAALATARELEAAEGVDRVITIADFVPDDQEEKLEILADVNMFLDLPPATQHVSVSVDEQIEALTALRDFLGSAPIENSDAPLASSARKLHTALEQLLATPSGDRQAALRELERVLMDPVPSQVERLREILSVGEISRSDLPPGLVTRMLSPEGPARIQVYPTEDLAEHDAMVLFVETLRSITPDITGLPVNLVESARATWESLREALFWAVAAITLLLLALWRRVGDTLLALGPLLLAVLLTQVTTVVLPISFNFVNVIVLPLLLGIGIDGGVHLVHRAARHREAEAGDLRGSTTARAVFYSGITTIASFGTLVLSDHFGISSLGVLLVVGMFWIFCANLVLLPALLTLRAARRGDGL